MAMPATPWLSQLHDPDGALEALQQLNREQLSPASPWAAQPIPTAPQASAPEQRAAEETEPAEETVPAEETAPAEAVIEEAVMEETDSEPMATEPVATKPDSSASLDEETAIEDVDNPDVVSEDVLSGTVVDRDEGAAEASRAQLSSRDVPAQTNLPTTSRVELSALELEELQRCLLVVKLS